MKLDFTTPEFLFCETPFKDDTPHDHRTWIYSTKSLSLIEFINTEDFTDFEFKDFTYFNYKNIEGEIESYIGVFTQNNCEATDNDSKSIMLGAWEVFQQYLTQIDEYEG